MFNHLLLAPLGALAFAAVAASAQTTPADLVLRNGKVVTMDAKTPQGQAVAITGDKITAVGSNAAIARYVGPKTKVIDLEGHLAIPGFNESHGHFTGLGSSLTQLKLMGVPSWQDIATMVRTRRRPPSPTRGSRDAAGIKRSGIARQDVWSKASRRMISSIRPHRTTRSCWVTRAVTRSSPTPRRSSLPASGPETPNPAGGEIIKDETGKPTGVLVDGAQGLVRRALSKSLAQRSAEETKADFRNEVHLAVQNALENGVTTFQDMGESLATVDGIKQSSTKATCRFDCTFS
jgi:Predicted metal-dependent hydrolase with the TIM-barrel fold